MRGLYAIADVKTLTTRGVDVIAFVRAVAYDKDREDPVATVQATFVINGDRGDAAKSDAEQGGDVS